MTTGELANFLMGTALGVAYLTAFPAPEKRLGFALAAIFAIAAMIIPKVW